LVIAAGLLTFALHLAFNGSRRSTVGAVSRARLNLLLITLDTTRADRLGAYGFRDVATPNLDLLAREGVLFEQTSTVAPLTLPAHSSLFTGQFPPRHAVHDNGGFVLPASQHTLAEILNTNRFHTGAFVGSYVLNAATGLNQGFDRYGDEFIHTPDAVNAVRLRRPANEVADDAIDWMARVPPADPFFAWLHFYDPHAPYEPPEPFASIYGSEGYLGAIAFVDSQIGRVLDALRQRRLLERTIVAVTGDHGEGLGEHGERTHKLFVYESVLHVPLILRVPSGFAPGRRVDSVTRSVDVLPTLLDLLGIADTDARDGTSLTPLMTGRVADLGLEAYAESAYPLLHFGWSDLRSFRVGNFKYIEAPRPELYDLRNDPDEQHNLYAVNQQRAIRLAAGLRALERSARNGAAQQPADSASMLGEETRQRLAALGYVGAGHSSPERNDRADPKDKIALLEQIAATQEALNASLGGTAARGDRQH
jgi:arylsulfatase A-like enzyme